MDPELEEDDAKFCSACLAVDGKMFLLSKCGYLEEFANITRVSFQAHQSAHPPVYVCYICLALLKKCSYFRSMCLLAQQLLNGLQTECHLVTKKHILKLQQPKLTCNYRPVKLLDQVNCLPETTDILSEIKVEDAEFEQEYNNFDADDYEHNEINDESPVDIKMFVAKVHSENLDEVKPVDDPTMCDPELDKPLAVLKTDILEKLLSSKKKKKVVKKSAKSIKKNEVKKAPSTVVRKRKAKFNKYNEKFEADFEEFCKEHNVEVVFLTKEQQIERMKEKYNDNKYRLRCELCYAGFMTDMAYEKHVKGHDPNAGPHVCDICQSRFKEKTGLQRHVRHHKKMFVCKLCRKSLSNSHLAMQHHRWHEGFKHECKHCKKKFNAMSTHLNHVREQHTEVRCKECGESFEGSIRLKRHRNTTHTECKDCHNVFRNARVLTRHVEVGCRPDLLPCLLCGINVPDEEVLQLHVRDKHDYKGTTRFKCEACPSTYSTDRARGAHWAAVHMGHKYSGNKLKRDRMHPSTDGAIGTCEDSAVSDGRVYLCELCAKSFKSIINLRQHHTTVHLDDRRFKCNFCSKAFASKCRLAVHINVHTGDRPYQCKFCPERFKSYSQRYKHRLLVHEKDRPHKCNLCEKDYVLLYDLKAHIRYAHLHHPRPPRKNPRRPRSQKI